MNGAVARSLPFVIMLSTVHAADIVAINPLKSYNGSGPLNGQTPCCVDRMTTVSCNRLMQLNSALFLYNCVHNADFAFVQCCKSCFDKKASFSMKLEYKDIADVQLTNPTTAICMDRRGEQWCERLVKRSRFWHQGWYRKLDCSSMPFAFRVCRQSCGYCSTSMQRAGAVYDYKIATDPVRCNNPSYGLALKPIRSRKLPPPNSLIHRFTLKPVTSLATTTSAPGSSEETSELPNQVRTVTFKPHPYNTLPPAEIVTEPPMERAILPVMPSTTPAQPKSTLPPTEETTTHDYLIITDQIYADPDESFDAQWERTNAFWATRLFRPRRLTDAAAVLEEDRGE